MIAISSCLFTILSIEAFPVQAGFSREMARVAVVGIAVGTGYFLIAITTTLLCLLVLVSLTPLRRRLEQRAHRKAHEASKEEVRHWEEEEKQY